MIDRSLILKADARLRVNDGKELKLPCLPVQGRAYLQDGALLFLMFRSEHSLFSSFFSMAFGCVLFYSTFEL